MVMVQVYLALVFFKVVALASVKTYYVKPSTSSNCPGTPCMTIDSYTEFESSSTYVFLPGKHRLQSRISITSPNVMARGMGPNITATIVCIGRFAFQCWKANNLTIEWLAFDLTENQWLSSQRYNRAAAIRLLNSTGAAITDCTFKGRGNISHITASAFQANWSTLKIQRCLFEENTGRTGGAIIAISSTLVLSDNVFINNIASYSGGAIAISRSKALLAFKNQFLYNFANKSGGAIHCEEHSILQITGTCSFESNHVNRYGGAISIILSSELTISGTTVFSNNMANQGGAISLSSSKLLLNGQSIIFSNNSAEVGGGIISFTSQTKANATVLKFIGNTANKYGGGISIADNIRFHDQPSELEITANFTNNSAECGRAVRFSSGVVIFINTNMTGNSNSAACISDSNVTFINTEISHNKGISGGGVNSEHSTLRFTGTTRLVSNNATTGGGINFIGGDVKFQGGTLFENNRAIMEGGGIYAVSSNIYIQNTMALGLNSASKGGAIYLNTATLIFTSKKNFVTFRNSASEYGGAIYNEDIPTEAQCKYTLNNHIFVPYCFVQFGNIIGVTMVANQNSAKIDGNFLYGGLLGKCRNSRSDMIYDIAIFELLFIQKEAMNFISSGVYELHLCTNYSIEVYRGQNFSLSVVATAQGGIPISAIVTAITYKSRLERLQNIQTISAGCSDLTYNLYSSVTSDELILYTDGPCQNSGLAKLNINVTFLPCPRGFTQSGEICTCEERLHAFNVDCKIESGIIQIIKRGDSNFWMGAVNESDGGLILYDSCPAEYCKTQAVSFTLEDLDAQCDLNRSGVLCGQCASNYSLMLGSSSCKLCSNNLLALLLAFATAGLALVAFLTFLKLTVATGTLNSLILFANVFQVNRSVFLPNNNVKVLTIFIAWLNLDLGIETCFYNGLTAFAQTWLQFLFPVYIWMLISLIVLIARHSVTVSRFIGSDPIAVLATLLLMSYTKILRIIIEVFSYANLDYPNEIKVRVWLKDGNVLYLSSGHLILTVMTSLVLVLLFLPYTLLLLLGHRLYPFAGHKHFCWLSRIKPLLESYYAPYKPCTRYWTGFLLLVRCALYIVFSFYSLGGTRISLPAIILTFTALAILGSGRIYKSTFVNAVEMFVYFNLVVLSTATLAKCNWPALVYLLIATIIAIMVCVIVYQFNTLYISKTALWLRLKAKLFKGPDNVRQAETSIPNPSDDANVSKSVIELREPLLESNQDIPQLTPSS